MKNEFAKREINRIVTNYQQTKKAMAFVASKPIHSAKVIERRTFAAIFMKIADWLGLFFGSLFGFGRSVKAYKPYIYHSPYQAPTPKCLRFGVYMRRRGRKYKRACA